MGGQNCQDVFCYTSAQCPNPMVTARLQLVNNRATYFPIAPTQTSIVLSPPKCNLHSWLPGHVGTHAPCGRQRLRPALSWSCTRNHATAKAEGRERRPFCNTRGEARVWCLQGQTPPPRSPAVPLAWLWQEQDSPAPSWAAAASHGLGSLPCSHGFGVAVLSDWQTGTPGLSLRP